MSEGLRPGQNQTQTHALTFSETEVRKRYVSWDRGEAEREWSCRWPGGAAAGRAEQDHVAGGDLPVERSRPVLL